MNQINSKRDFHREAEYYYMSMFNGKKDDKENFGDFFIKVNNNEIIGFEVYAPEGPMSLSTKKLGTPNIKKIGNTKCTYIQGGFDPNRLNQFIEKVLNEKNHQFEEKVIHSKILIVSCKYPNSFSGLDNFTTEFDNPIDYELLKPYPNCAAIFIDGTFNRTCIFNKYSKFSISKKLCKRLSTIFLKSQNI